MAKVTIETTSQGSTTSARSDANGEAPEAGGLTPHGANYVLPVFQTSLLGQTPFGANQDLWEEYKALLPKTIPNTLQAKPPEFSSAFEEISRAELASLAISVHTLLQRVCSMATTMAHLPSPFASGVKSGNTSPLDATFATRRSQSGASDADIVSQLSDNPVIAVDGSLPENVVDILQSPPVNGGAAMRGAPRYSVTSQVLTTDKVSRGLDADGFKMINDYVVLDEIGRGAFGKVKLAWSDRRGQVAIKIMRRNPKDQKMLMQGSPIGAARMRHFQREIAIMKKARHHNVVKLYEVIDDPEEAKVYLVMQYVDNGCLAKVGADGKLCSAPLGRERLLDTAKQMIAGLSYLHNNSVIHRDIKPENVLINNDGDIFLSDFGVSDIFEEDNEPDARGLTQEMIDSNLQSTTSAASDLGTSPICTPQNKKVPGLTSRDGSTNTLRSLPDDAITSGSRSPRAGDLAGGQKRPRGAGTVAFMAPELFFGGGHSGVRDEAPTSAVDIWATGVTWFTLFTGTIPFKNSDEICALRGAFDVAKAAPSMPTEWQALLSSMIHANPTHRPTATSVKAAIKKMIKTTQAKNERRATLRVIISDEEVDGVFTPRRRSTAMRLPAALTRASVVSIGSPGILSHTNSGVGLHRITSNASAHARVSVSSAQSRGLPPFQRRPMGTHMHSNTNSNSAASSLDETEISTSKIVLGDSGSSLVAKPPSTPQNLSVGGSLSARVPSRHPSAYQVEGMSGDTTTTSGGLLSTPKMVKKESVRFREKLEQLIEEDKKLH